MAVISSAGGLTPASLETIVWLVVAIAILFAFLRFIIRLYALRKLLEDDVAVMFALLLLLSLAIMYRYATPIMFELNDIATGKEKLTPDFISRAAVFLKLQFAIIVLFWTTIWVVKISFLIFYRTLFSGLPDHMFGACETPRDIHYSNACLYVAAAGDVASDIMSKSSDPQQGIELMISVKEKFALGAIFSVGVIKITFAIIRVVKIGASSQHVNPIWLALWSMIEASVAVVVACLPSFKVLFARGRRQSQMRHAVTLKRFRPRGSHTDDQDLM
ncbi:MAG: hypothetical protein LQ350_007166 [Teloschistes chrysophthalmus]|nr:MAG: hypothetical protein LQ350_007166 [Niorma chrysophthalma]